MKTTATPETNELIRTQLARVGITPTALAANLTLKCEDLERERNEARKELRALTTMNTPTNSEALPLTNCSALAILQGCGLHGGYYDTIEKAAEGAREIIYALRANLHDPPHDIQCTVLRKLGVDGFAKTENTTHRLVMFNPNSPHNDDVRRDADERPSP